MKFAKLATVILGAVLLCSATAMAAEYDAANPPVADTAQGQVLGFMDEGTFAFLGIPYATAGRFEEPQKVEPWEGIRSAQTYGTICPFRIRPVSVPTKCSGPTAIGFRTKTA